MRRIDVLPGVTVNLARHGARAALGVRGAQMTVGKHGVAKEEGGAMDGARFDAWARRLAAPTSRRQLLGGLLAGLAGSVGLACGGSTHGGTGTGTSHTPAPTPPLDEHALTRAECEARGGSFKRWGLSGEEFCQVPAADAGTRCTDGSMCSLGKCITTTHASPGGCQEYRLTFGCFATVTHGTVGSVVCVD